MTKMQNVTERKTTSTASKQPLADHFATAVKMHRRPVASIPIPNGRSLRPVKNGGTSFDKDVDQKFPFFTEQTP